MKKLNNIPIPGIGEEDIVYFTRRHVASLLGTFILIFFMILVPVLLGLGLKLISTATTQHLSSNVVMPILAIYYLVIVTFAFVEWVNFYYSFFILTKDEIVDITQQGFFNRQITQISVVRVQDVSASVKGFLPTFFGYGDVIAESAGEKTQSYVIEKIPRPMDVADKIIEIHDYHMRHDKNADNLGAFHEDPTLTSAKPPAQPAQGTLSVQGEIKNNDLNQGGEVKF